MAMGNHIQGFKIPLSTILTVLTIVHLKFMTATEGFKKVLCTIFFFKYCILMERSNERRFFFLNAGDLTDDSAPKIDLFHKHSVLFGCF